MDSLLMEDFRPKKPVITTSVPTLKKIASVTLAVSTIFNTSSEKLSNEKIIEKLRGTLKKMCFMYVVDLCLEMTKNWDKWISYHKERCDQLDENAFDSLEDIVWHQDGAINCLGSVMNLLASDKLCDMGKFRLACSYCLEKEIEIFWKSVVQNKVPDLEILFQTHPLIGYWCYRCAGELDMVHVNEPMTVDEFMIRNQLVDNWPAIEYFFEHLNPKAQATVALRLIENDKKRKYQKSVLSNLNQDQRSYVYAKRILKIMGNFFHCDYIDVNIPDIVSIWHEARASITKHEFGSLIELFGKYDTSGVILEKIWTSANEEFKNYVLNLYDYDFIGVVLQRAYHIDSLGFDFLFVVLADAIKLDGKPHIAERIKFFDRLYKKMMAKNK